MNRSYNTESTNRATRRRRENNIDIPQTEAEAAFPVTFRVRNVGREARAPELEEHFRHYGKLRRVRIAIDPRSDRSKGFGYVQFDEFPRDMFDETKPEIYRRARLFLDRMIVIEPAPLIPDVEHDEETYLESFEVESLQVGSFVDDSGLFMPYSMKKEHQILLELSHHNRILWHLRADAEHGDDYMMRCSRESTIYFEHFKENDDYFITIRLKSPPRIYRGKYGYIQEVGLWHWTKQYEKIWHRTVNVHRYPNIPFGEHLTYRFKLAKSDAVDLSLRDKIDDLYRSGHRIIFCDDPGLVLHKKIPNRFMTLAYLSNFDFDVVFKLMALMSIGIISKWCITPTLLDFLKQSPPKLLIRALEIITVENVVLHDFEAKLKHLVPRVATSVVTKPVPHINNCVYIRKVIVTPTRFLYMPPCMELGNRVIRNFSEYHDRFLRVAFADEDLTKFQDGSLTSDDVFARIRRILRDGITIGTRHYEFLAFSSSQLRESSCWFFSPVMDETKNLLIDTEHIRGWMGNFSHITNVAKYAARLGQCFSSTTPFHLPSDSFAEIPDVERNGYCFSDGIGRMSVATAEKIRHSLELDSLPSAFQVRMNGYKGVLSVHPGIKPHEPQIQFRPSMRKFTTSYNGSLDIIRHSQYSPAYLNHQIITLLNSVGVREETFINLQRKMERLLDRIFVDSAAAIHLLSSYASENATLSILRSMLLAGVDIKNEPFLSNLLHLFQCHKLREAKLKARILVEDGVQLVGILDETGTLEYGQMFVQYSDPYAVDGRRSKIVKGRVLMAKMPAVHPGDIRVLECVDKPALRHYIDVAVFPQKGPRPHPNEASGSDLDGDVYFITWHRGLLPKLRNFVPMNYTSPPPALIRDPVTIEDVKDFMIQYMKEDFLGLIATAHKIHADLSSQGVRSENCITLAELHSLAVDFPKTGVPADFDAKKYHVAAYPDFLHKLDKPSYRSDKALGALYRDAKSMRFRPDFDVKVDPMFMVDGFEKYLRDAKNVKAQYDFELQKTMRTYSIRSEFEVVSQLFIDVITKGFKKEYDLKNTVAEVLKKSRSHFRKIFWRGLEDPVTEDGEQSKTDMSSPEAMKKACAWYYVAYHTDRDPSSWETDAPVRMFSFPWMMVSDILIEIYRVNRQSNLTSAPASKFDKLDNGIYGDESKPDIAVSTGMLSMSNMKAEIVDRKSTEETLLMSSFEILDI